MRLSNIFKKAKDRVEQMGYGAIAGGVGTLLTLSQSNRLNRLFQMYPEASGDIAYLLALMVAGGASGAVAMSHYKAKAAANAIPLSSWEELLEAKERWLHARKIFEEELQTVNPNTRKAIVEWVSRDAGIQLDTGAP